MFIFSVKLFNKGEIIMTRALKKFNVALSAIASLALAFGVLSAQSACVCWFHQPEIPEGMKKFAK
jgi:cyclic lactone autoinducer peptide